MTKTLILISVVTFFSQAQAENHKCFNNSGQEHAEMFAAFRSKEHTGFEKKFHNYCEKYADKLVCSVESVDQGSVPQKMKELIAQGPCTEVLRIDEGNVAKLYFINDKVQVKK